MRKCAAILCAALLTVSACACGKDTDPVTKTTVHRITTTTTATPVKDYTDVPGKAPLNLTYATSFSDGVAFVRYLDSDGVEHAAAINTAADVLFELPEGMPFDGPGYKDGIRVVDNVIYDKTGAVIASPELSGYDTLMTGSCGGYVLAKKSEALAQPNPENSLPNLADNTNPTDTESSDAPVNPVTPPSTKVSVGVLNSKGEWVHDLSADHPIAAAMAAATQPTESLEYIATAGVLKVQVDVAGTPQYYHFKDNKLTVDYVRYASFGYSPEEAAGIYQMATDGSKKLVVENVIGDYFFADAFIGRSVTPPAITETEPTLGTPKLYNYKGEELMDLEAYPLSGPLAFYHGGYLTLPTTDAVGSRLLVILDAQGQPVMDPLVLGMRDVYYPPDVSGFVVESYTADGAVSYRHYDYTGAVTEYSDVAAFAGFVEGLAAVTLRGDDTHHYYINHRAEIVLR